jgi:hypothetical protein
VIAYQTEGPIVVIRATGPYTVVSRDLMYDAIGADEEVQPASGVLIDARLNVVANGQSDFREAFEAMVARLGPKLPRACAVVMARHRIVEAHMFQAIGGDYGVRVGLFYEEDLARQWLMTHVAADSPRPKQSMRDALSEITRLAGHATAIVPLPAAVDLAPEPAPAPAETRASDVLLWSREHGNGSIAEVVRLVDGSLVGRERRVKDDAIGQYIGDLDSVHLAQSVADALAHPGCSGSRCGRWVTFD